MGQAVDISSATVEMLSDYSKVPMYVDVSHELRLERINNGIMGLRLAEQPVSQPYRKSYEDPTDAPMTWKTRWDLSNWGFFVASCNGLVIGGAVVAYRTVGLDMLQGRDDLAVLWDIRVSPEWKRSGVGTRLFGQVKAFAQERRCKYVKIETQNINVPACRFYQKQGCYLGGILQHAYREYPDEIELLWYLPLAA